MESPIKDGSRLLVAVTVPAATSGTGASETAGSTIGIFVLEVVGGDETGRAVSGGLLLLIMIVFISILLSHPHGSCTIDWNDSQ